METISLLVSDKDPKVLLVKEPQAKPSPLRFFCPWCGAFPRERCSTEEGHFYEHGNYHKWRTVYRDGFIAGEKAGLLRAVKTLNELAEGVDG